MSNAEQIEYWNAEAGKNWVAHADALDLMLQGVGEAVIAQAALKPDKRVLDIGCGSGAVTLAAQNQIGNNGRATGLDISRPLLANARRRAAERNSPATFMEGDAATWRGDFKTDHVVSRFGVMFFDDPTAAFANIRQLTRPEGRLNFACWRNPKENDMGGGLMKAVAHLFTPPDVKPDPKAPGPFAFADRDYLTEILVNAGWRDVKFEAWDGKLPLPGASASDNANFLAHMGPIGRAMREQNVAAEAVMDALAPFLEQRNDNGRFALNGAVWLVSARR